MRSVGPIDGAAAIRLDRGMDLALAGSPLGLPLGSLLAARPRGDRCAVCDRNCTHSFLTSWSFVGHGTKRLGFRALCVTFLFVSQDSHESRRPTSGSGRTRELRHEVAARWHGMRAGLIQFAWLVCSSPSSVPSRQSFSYTLEQIELSRLPADDRHLAVSIRVPDVVDQRCSVADFGLFRPN
jgi:hypothetical protein